MLSTAGGEVAPLTYDGDECYLKLLVNNSIEFKRVDVWTPCHVCPTRWVRSSGELGKENHVNVNDSATIYWSRRSGDDDFCRHTEIDESNTANSRLSRGVSQTHSRA